VTSLSQKIKLALDESRMLILGAQILLGFQFRATFEKGFALLPHSSHVIKMIALGVLLVAIALIMWPGAYHRIVRHGEDTTDVHDFTNNVMDIALFPFIAALSLEFYVLSRSVVGLTGGIVLGVLTAVFGIALLYGLGLMSRLLGWDVRGTKRTKREDAQMEKSDLYNKIEQVLIETRVVLPGVQALFGFQLATMLIEGFERLPNSSKYCHLISMALMAITVILLMTPAAYHRIVERGEATEHFHLVASNFLLMAMISLPLGICGDLFVVVRNVTNSVSIAVTSSLLSLLFFYALWFGYTLYRRHEVKNTAQ
jgi:Family of unknown function (DUF6328)